MKLETTNPRLCQLCCQKLMKYERVYTPVGNMNLCKICLLSAAFPVTMLRSGKDPWRQPRTMPDVRSN